MSNIPITVDTAIEVFVNEFPLTDDTDFKTRETSVAYNATGMDLVWNFQTAAGVPSQTAVTPTTGGDYDWTHVGDGMYKIEIPASGGASINNDTEGVGWFTGVCTGVLPWKSPRYEFKPANLIGGLHTGGDRLEVDTFEIEGVDATDALDAKVKFETTIATYASNTSFVLTHKPPDNSTLVNWTYVVTDQSTASQKGIGWVTAYDGTGTAGTVTNNDAGIYTYAVGDFVTYYPPGTVHPGQIRAALGMSAADFDTRLTAIVDDTNELQTDWANGGRLDLLIDSIVTAVTAVLPEITGTSDVPATPTPRQAWMAQYMALRNNTGASTTERKIRNDAGSVVLESTIDDDGTEFQQGKLRAPD